MSLNFLDIVDDVLSLIVNQNVYCYTRFSLVCKKLASLRDKKKREEWKKLIIIKDLNYVHEVYKVLPNKNKDGLYMKYFPFSEQEFIRCSYDNGRLHGDYMVYHNNGTLKKLFHFIQGKLHGTSLFWDSSGNLEKEINFRKDFKHGPCYLWSNGQFVEKSFFYRGKKHGWFIHKKQALFSRTHYYLGKIHGLYEVYHVSGRYQMGYYLFNKKHGLHLSLDFNTKTFEIKMYNLGRLHGFYQKTAGDITVTGQYFHNQRHGTWITKFQETSVLDTRTYEYGRIAHTCDRIEKKFMDSELRFLEWFNNGKMKKQGKYVIKNGFYFPDGQFSVFYPNGNLKKFCEYRDGVLDGIYYEFFYDGSLKLYQEFRNGKPQGRYFRTFPPSRGFYDNGKYLIYVWDFEGEQIIYMETHSRFIEFDRKTGSILRMCFKNGKCFEYYSGGSLKSMYTMRGGKMYGKYQEWSITGSMKLECFFHRDKILPTIKFWNLSGELEIDMDVSFH